MADTSSFVEHGQATSILSNQKPADTTSVHSAVQDSSRPFYRNKWILAAAAVLVVGAILGIVHGSLAGAGVLGGSKSSQQQTGSPTVAPTDSNGPTTTDSGQFSTRIAMPTATDILNPPPAKPVWRDMQQLFMTWSEWKSLCGNGKCDEGEWCRNCPEDCPCTVNCGNGLCEDGENGDTCAQDCTHQNSVCGNGRCEDRVTTNWENKYENVYNCPLDCPSTEACGNGVCSSTESCFVCPEDCGQCASFCGNENCEAGETCSTCPRDCGLCNVVAGDGICSWPRENLTSPDCEPAQLTNVYSHEGVTYATIDDIPMESSDGSCPTTFPINYIPNGWKLATYNNRAARLLRLSSAAFGGYCAVFDDGFALPSGGSGGPSSDCYQAPLYEIIDQGLRMGYRSSPLLCGHSILIERIDEALAAAEADPTLKKSCPGDCFGRGSCNILTGECQCNAPWTGMYCQRQIGDWRVPDLSTARWWQPPAGISWNWELQYDKTPIYNVDLYDVDLYASKDYIQRLHSQGKHVICYFSAGSTEDFRPDSELVPPEAKGGILVFGEGDDFVGENWLDLRRPDLFGSVMLRRIEDAKRLGCDGIEFDNPDSVIHQTNFTNGGMNTVDQCIIFAKWLTGHTHALGMSTALKNSNEFASFLRDTHDMVVNEECWINGNCDNYWPFIQANKPVLNTEYFTTRCMYCDRANRMDFSTIKKQPPLTGCMVDCRGIGGPWNTSSCDAAGYGANTAYPIRENWCMMTTNTDTNECAAPRFATCDPATGY